MIAQLDDDLETGATVAEVPTGDGALNVAFDPVNRLAYAANFGGTTITVVNPDGTKVANLPFSRANHLAEDGQGAVDAVNKGHRQPGREAHPRLIAGTPAVTGTARGRSHPEGRPPAAGRPARRSPTSGCATAS